LHGRAQRVDTFGLRHPVRRAHEESRSFLDVERVQRLPPRPFSRAIASAMRPGFVPRSAIIVLDG